MVKIHQHTQFQVIPSMRSPGNAWKPQIWPVSLSQNSVKIRKINRPWPSTNHFWRCLRYISIQKFRPFIPCVLRQMSGNHLPGRMSGRTDGWTCRKTVTVGRMDRRDGPMYKWKEGISGFERTNGTDVQPENIMLPVPKGGGIKWNTWEEKKYC